MYVRIASPIRSPDCGKVRSDRVGREWSGTLRVAALRDLFAGGLVTLGRRDPLLDPSLVIDPGDAGRAALAEALAAWGMD